MTVEEFLDIYDGVDGKFELIDGVVYAMGGGTPRHSVIAVAIASELRSKLRGGPCRVFNSDMGLRINADTLTYPDVAVYCDPRDLTQDLNKVLAFSYPTAIFEVLSPSATNHDRGAKLADYKSLPSVKFIALIHPSTAILETAERHGADEWHEIRHPAHANLVVSALGVELQAADIFEN